MAAALFSVYFHKRIKTHFVGRIGSSNGWCFSSNRCPHDSNITQKLGGSAFLNVYPIRGAKQGYTSGGRNENTLQLCSMKHYIKKKKTFVAADALTCPSVEAHNEHVVFFLIPCAIHYHRNSVERPQNPQNPTADVRYVTNSKYNPVIRYRSCIIVKINIKVHHCLLFTPLKWRFSAEFIAITCQKIPGSITWVGLWGPSVWSLHVFPMSVWLFSGFAHSPTTSHEHKSFLNAVFTSVSSSHVQVSWGSRSVVDAAGPLHAALCAPPSPNTWWFVVTYKPPVLLKCPWARCWISAPRLHLSSSVAGAALLPPRKTTEMTNFSSGN